MVFVRLYFYVYHIIPEASSALPLSIQYLNGGQPPFALHTWTSTVSSVPPRLLGLFKSFDLSYSSVPTHIGLF
jgi:hypothetical protein